MLLCEVSFRFLRNLSDYGFSSNDRLYEIITLSFSANSQRAVQETDFCFHYFFKSSRTVTPCTPKNYFIDGWTKDSCLLKSNNYFIE